MVSEIFFHVSSAIARDLFLIILYYFAFLEVVPDGVGIGYAVKADSCIFNITARRDNNWTGGLCHLLEEALLEMRLMNDMDSTIASKL